MVLLGRASISSDLLQISVLEAMEPACKRSGAMEPACKRSESMEPACKRSRPAPQQSARGLGELPLELLHRLLALCSITDILAVAQALSRPEVAGVLLRPVLWARAVVGPRLYLESLGYLGSHTRELTMQGQLKLDSKRRPRKEKFFKSSEFVPSYILSSLAPRCAHLTKLTFDRCVFGPGFKSSIFPETLHSITFRSCIFVRKSSFFDAIWSNVPSLKELRIENILNFSKRDCYAVVTSLSIDFDIQFSSGDSSPSFIFYKSLNV